MQNEQSEILQQLRRISRLCTITAWATSIAAILVIAHTFFPKAIKELSGITGALDRAISLIQGDWLSTGIGVLVVLALAFYSIYYVIARISGAPAPVTEKRNEF